MARLEEDINPKILGWARERAGLSLEKAAKKIGLSSQKLAKMENGESKPTRRQLREIAKRYWYPLTVFYAPQPPLLTKGGVDFRSSQTTREEQGMLDALVRDIYSRQSIVKSILEDDEDEEPRSFVGSLKDTDDIPSAVEAIRKILNLPDDRALDFNGLRERVQSIGIFVLLLGNLGSQYTKIHETTFRGLAIADSIAPFIVINPNDAQAARSFTLIHELTHVMMDKSGISGEVDIDNSEVEHRRVEKFCNDVASNFLLPPDSIKKIEKINDPNTAINSIAKIAKGRKVSNLMVAYRFLRENIISEKTYRTLGEIYLRRWEEEKERRKIEAKQKKVAVNPNVVKKQRLGKLLVGFIERSLNAQELTYTKAANLLGVDATSVRVLIEVKKK